MVSGQIRGTRPEMRPARAPSNSYTVRDFCAMKPRFAQVRTALSQLARKLKGRPPMRAALALSFVLLTWYPAVGSSQATQSTPAQSADQRPTFKAIVNRVAVAAVVRD